MLVSPDDIVGKISILPPSPALAREVIRVCQDENTDISHLLKLLASDQALTLQILKVANSSFYQYGRQVNSVERAAVILGIKLIKEIAFSLSLNSFFGNILLRNTEISAKLASHALNTALILKILGENFDSTNYELLYYGGLLHDCGKWALLIYLNEEYILVMEKSIREKKSLLELEAEYIGTNHAEVGASLLKKWGLPENLVALTRLHHEPREHKTGEKLDFWIRLVYLANLISNFIENDLTHYNELKNLELQYEDILTLTEDEFTRLVDQSKREIHDHRDITQLLEPNYS